MSEPWTAERVVDEALARELVEAQFPDLAGAPFEPFGVGWDNTAWLVGGVWVFRFPRRPIAVPLLEREIRLVPAIAPRLPLPVPVNERVGRPSERFPWPFAGYRLLRGTTGCRAALDDDQRTAAAAPLGRFLAALHAIEDGAALDAAGDLFDKANVPRRAQIARAELTELGDAVDLPRLERVIDTAKARPAPPTLVHGDLYARHVLVDERGAPCGIIDWGDIHLGDPAVDLALAHLFLPPAARDAFRAAYGDIDEATWRLAAFHALFHAANCARYGRAVGDAALLDDALRALAWIG